ncbi:hypothetical protein ACFL2K_02425 [Candidatus Margulisiibacteriota bacterium]
MAEQFKKRRKLNKNEAEKLIPIFREFNKVAQTFLRLLNRRVEKKEKKIAVMVSSMSMPETKHSINVQTVDIRNTMVSKKGGFTGSRKMDWEDDILKNLRRGSVI